MIPLGILGNRRGGAAAGAYELISTTVLGSATESVTFDVSTYASTYKHLQIRMTAKLNVENGSSEALVRFNGDSSSSYSWHYLTGTGSSVTSSAGTTQTFMLSTSFPNSNGGSSAFGAGVIDILDPFSISKYKTIRTLSGQLDYATIVRLASGSWRSTSAVTSITVIGNPGYQMKAGSRFSLYGIKG